MDTSTEKQWQARVFHEDDKPSLLRLAAAHFGEREPGKEAYFDWLYSDGPAGKALVPVGEQLPTGEIVGFNFQVPFHVKFGDEYGICHLGCNALVNPDYRRKGIYGSFNDIAVESLTDSLFIYGFPKPQAVVAHQNVGKFPISNIPLLVRPLDIGRLTKARFANPAIRLLVDSAWGVAGNTIWRPRRSHANHDGIQISVENSFDERFDRFWVRVADKYAIIVKRDAAFLSWRFSSPTFREYKTLAASVDGKLIGYAILRSTEIEGVRTGLVVDFLVEAGERGAQAGLLLLERAAKVFEKDGMALAGCLMLPHAHEFKILRRAGYVEPPARLSPQRFMLMALNLSSKAPKETLTRADNWFMTMANHDAV